MDSELKALVTFGALAIALVVGIPAGCNMHEDAMVAKMVEAGADPVAAKCGVGTESSNSCIAYLLGVKAP